jgi:hypothetical protein
LPDTWSFFTKKYTNIRETAGNGGIVSIFVFAAMTKILTTKIFLFANFLSRESLASYYRPIIVLSPVTSRWKRTNI